jgi:hypothetical protein
MRERRVIWRADEVAGCQLYDGNCQVKQFACDDGRTVEYRWTTRGRGIMICIILTVSTLVVTGVTFNVFRPGLWRFPFRPRRH